VNEVEETCGVFVESGEDTPVIFEFSDETFDMATFFIQCVIAVLRRFAISLWRDAGFSANAARGLKIGVRIIAAISQDDIGLALFHQAQAKWAIGCSAGRENELQRVAMCIDA